MKHDQTIVDASSPQKICDAIRFVNNTPGLRIQSGIAALWDLYREPSHSLLRSDIEKRYGAFSLRFGWFCRRVAEELGANQPDPLALVDYSLDGNGAQVLTLKPSVAAAIATSTFKPKISS